MLDTTNIYYSTNVSTEQLVLIVLALIVNLVAYWLIFAKSGKPGWAALIPVYNIYVYLKIVGRPVWWLLLILVPIVNVLVYIIVTYDLAKSFGKGIGYTLLMLLVHPVGQLMLAFGKATYTGPYAAK